MEKKQTTWKTIKSINKHVVIHYKTPSWPWKPTNIDWDADAVWRVSTHDTCASLSVWTASSGLESPLHWLVYSLVQSSTCHRYTSLNAGDNFFYVWVRWWKWKYKKKQFVVNRILTSCNEFTEWKNWQNQFYCVFFFYYIVIFYYYFFGSDFICYSLRKFTVDNFNLIGFDLWDLRKKCKCDFLLLIDSMGTFGIL
jgi:hypothetical protein